MNAKDLTKALAGHAFLHGLRAGQIRTMAGFTRLMTFPAGTHVLREGDAADAFYLLHLGRVAIQLHSPQRGPMAIQTLEPGDIVGWSWLLPPYRWHFDARAVEPTQALAVDAERLRQTCDEDHDLGYELLRRLLGVVAGRLSATRLQLLDIFK